MTTVFKDKELVVPPSIRRQAGIKQGDRLEFKVSGGVITILPKLPNADDEYTPELRKIIDAQLAESEEDIKQGRVYGPFETLAELERSLRETTKEFKKSSKRSTRR
ncbi:MAG: AbrB/MazE/SpoVT family DNA-binding domain-containing protein [Acidobacteriia bacterium]|nr:AbrB/MazE/SpoVT family DNA-binding domain-containing protein [Terriglobia bacterium]